MNTLNHTTALPLNHRIHSLPPNTVTDPPTSTGVRPRGQTRPPMWITDQRERGGISHGRTERRVGAFRVGRWVEQRETEREKAERNQERSRGRSERERETKAARESADPTPYPSEQRGHIVPFATVIVGPAVAA